MYLKAPNGLSSAVSAATRSSSAGPRRVGAVVSAQSSAVTLTRPRRGQSPASRRTGSGGDGCSELIPGPTADAVQPRQRRHTRDGVRHLDYERLEPLHSVLRLRSEERLSVVEVERALKPSSFGSNTHSGPTGMVFRNTGTTGSMIGNITDREVQPLCPMA